MSDVRVLSDQEATKDLLGFNRYLDPLVSILTNPTTETPFTIGIFGSWGTGKSTLLDLLRTELDQSKKGKFVCVRFNPWIYRNEPNVLIPLLHTIRDTLEADSAHRFSESAKKIGRVLLNLGADLFLKHMTVGAVDLATLEKLEAKYLTSQSKVQSEMRELRQILQNEADSINEQGAKLVLMIDDLDRCEPNSMLSVLESVKLFLDLRNVFILIAVDKQIVDQGIAIKYHKFELAERAQAIGAEYIEKMVQLPLNLFPLAVDNVANYMISLEPPQVVTAQIPLLAPFVTANPRKIKRILNLFTVYASIADRAYQDKQGRPADELLARMVVLQVQSHDLYREALTAPDALVALEAVYNDKKDVNTEAHFTQFGNRAHSVQEFCRSFYSPDSYLAKLFAGAPFKTEDTVRACLTMLGDTADAG